MTQPSISDADRTVTYTPTGAAGPFPVPFPLFDGVGADLAVTLDGVTVAGWTFSGALESGFYGAPNTWVDGSITFNAPITGSLKIDGNRAPRRVAQFQEGRGVPARDLNTELNILTAIARELWMRGRRTAQSLADLAAQTATIIPTILGYLSAANDAAARAQSWAEQPYGQPVISDPDGRSALHWQELAHQWATEAEAWAGSVGGLIYDFGLLSEDTTTEEDWGTL